jgi:hypothetical protein
MTFPAPDYKTFVGDHGQDFRIADHPPGGSIDPDNRRSAGSASSFFHLFPSLFLQKKLWKKQNSILFLL